MSLSISSPQLYTSNLDVLYEMFRHCTPKIKLICAQVCKQWHAILMRYADLFFRNSKVFMYMCKVPINSITRELRLHYRRSFNQHILHFLKTIPFHQLLTTAIMMRKSPREICRDLFWYIPNPMQNYRHLSKTSLYTVKKALQQTYQPFFAHSIEICKAAYWLSFRHHNIDIWHIYNHAYAFNAPMMTRQVILQIDDITSDIIPWDVYKTTMHLNNLIWIFLLINIDFTSAVITEQYPYGIFA